ncbi:GNAT family N-acetyltransferase [Kineococcus gypseus]|uniref:GNAT family N-acetyltransferase n=1 Tax=Kineococcus gypseus TaxID=1637102 RepID=UPI003D7DC023
MDDERQSHRSPATPRADAADVRRAEPGELRLLPAVELAADALFARAGVALPEQLTDVAELEAAACVLVTGRPPVGFARLDVLDGNAHLEQVSVHPGHVRRGLGTALLGAAVAWARARGFPALTLTTFEDVAWNAPWYRRHGFTDLQHPGPELLEQRRAEVRAGLDGAGRRVVLHLPLHPGA